MAAEMSTSLEDTGKAQETEKAELRIGEIARQVCVAPSAIRYYEEIGLLPPPVRINGRRRYTQSTLQRLRVIARAQQAGFTLGEIHELFFGFAVGTHPTARWEALAQRKLAEIEEQQRRMCAMLALLREGLRCGCLTMEQCTVWLSGLEHTGVSPIRLTSSANSSEPRGD